MKKIKNPMLLVAIIYLAFICLGLPDGILGVAWPAMRVSLNQPLESVGILTSLLLFMSAFSSIISGALLRRFGTGGVTFVSVLFTGIALLGYSLTPGFYWLVLFTVPLGLGQGAVDSGLNFYVAEHYSARHMSWLHCFWGVGASLGPFIMTSFLGSSGNWRGGYRTVSVTLLVLSGVLLFSLIAGVWKNASSSEPSPLASAPRAEGILHRLPHQALAVLLFFFYSGVEFTLGTWLNTVLVESRQVPVTLAGLSITCYYASIMVGRFFTGFIVNRAGNARLIRLGLLFTAAGVLLIAFSSSTVGMFLGTICIGISISPVYPGLMHETPLRFTKAVSSRLFGFQTGAACLGGSVLCAGTGIILSRFSLELLFPIVLVLLAAMFFGNLLLARWSRQTV